MSGKLFSITESSKKMSSIDSYPGMPITQTLNNGFFTVDHKWTVQYWNRAAEEILGVSAKEMIGENLWEKFVDVLPLEFYAVYEKAFLPDIPIHFEEYWGEMGGWFDVITYYCDDVLSVSFKSSNHQFAHKEKPVERLKVMTEMYRLVTEVTNDSLWEWDLQAKEIFWIDGGHKRMFRYPIENALIPQSFWENRLHADDKLRVLEKLSKLADAPAGAVWDEEYRFLKANNEYAWVHERGHIIYEDEKATRMIGATQDISRRKAAESSLLKERDAKQTEITEAVLAAQEHEREEIGKELHDNVNQILGTAKLFIEMARLNDQKRTMYLDKAADFIVNTIAELRQISNRLMPPGAYLNLIDSINLLVDDIKATQHIKIDFKNNSVGNTAMPDKIQLNIFRIVQEQLNNIIKHAEATRVHIELNRQEDEVILIISDNGKGADPEKKSTGIGIRNIISRAELHGGAVDIMTRPEEGYQLKVTMHLDKMVTSD